jgi:predicted RNase H-like HicB family nuclease
MKYAIVIEKAESNYSAYVPDLPGCVTVGGTIEEVYRMMLEAIQFHLEGMKLDDEPIPEPTSQVGYVEVDLARVDANVAAERKRLRRGAATPRSNRRR